MSATGAVALVEGESDRIALHALAGMPAQRGWSREAVLRRSFGSRARRKAMYARLLVEALAPDSAPRPRVALLAHLAPVA